MNTFNIINDKTHNDLIEGRLNGKYFVLYKKPHETIEIATVVKVYRETAYRTSGGDTYDTNTVECFSEYELIAELPFVSGCPVVHSDF